MKQTSELKRSWIQRKPKMEPKKQLPRCAICKQRFEPLGKFQAKACGPDCAIELVARDKARIAAAKARKERAEDKKKRISLKTRTEYANDAQKAVNLYVKWRDWGKPCVSCGRAHNPGVARDASHLKSRGANSALRYNLWNLNMACVQCNMSNSGNIAEYYPRLIERIGQEKVDYLHNAKRERRYEIDYLLRLKKIFNQKARRMEKIKLSEVK